MHRRSTTPEVRFSNEWLISLILLDTITIQKVVCPHISLLRSFIFFEKNSQHSVRFTKEKVPQASRITERLACGLSLNYVYEENHVSMSKFCDDEDVVFRSKDPLRRLIREQMDLLLSAKEMYDRDYPQHFKPISSEELWRIARKRVMEIVCCPTSPDESDPYIKYFG
jgi:hypothetical protein